MSSTSFEPRAAAYGLFPLSTDLSEVVDVLQSAGFCVADMCLMVPPVHPISDALRHGQVALSPEGEDLGNALGLLTRFGAVVIPGVGVFVGSKFFLKTLIKNEGAGASGTAALTCLGLPQSNVQRYEKLLRTDFILVFVHCSELARAHWAREILYGMKAVEARLLGGGELAMARAV